MNKKIARVWAKDLETTNAPRAFGRLKRKDGYCCLGRLGLVLKRKFPEVAEKTGWEWGQISIQNNKQMGFRKNDEKGNIIFELTALPGEVMKYIGMTGNKMNYFVELNDEKKYSFKKIAKRVRKNYL
jgi:hypothetical protein